MAVGESSKRARKLAAARIDPPPPPPPVEVTRRRRRLLPRVTEVGVGVVALFVSGAAFLGNLALFMRGSEIAVLEPEQFVIYRDAGPNGADLYVALPIAVINAARADYGDVVTGGTVSFESRTAPPVKFVYEAIIEPVMTQHVDRAIEGCPDGARCIAATGFYVIERPAKLLDVPGGASRTEHMAFHVGQSACVGPAAACAQFDGFDRSLAILRAMGPLTIKIDVDFYFDGRKHVECRLPAAAAERDAIWNYLAQKGWAMPACAKREQ